MARRDTSSSLPVIGITMGCPVGVGPEIILQILSENKKQRTYIPVLFGDMGVLEKVNRELSLRVSLKLSSLQNYAEMSESGYIPVLSPSQLDITRLVWGQPDVHTGKAMASYIEEAVSSIQAGKIDAMVTCPIAKSSLKEAGYHYPGHTEMLASLCETSNYAMMMSGKSLKVVLVTIHTSLVKVPSCIKSNEVLRLIQLTHAALGNDFGIDKPRIGVAGLNPHAGESDMFGDEETKEIAPAVAQAKEIGIQATGPLPPDTIFFRAANGEFDAVVAMYHDQGLIPFKLLHFADGVNITLGLPIVRTSVDHGTAYDIAGKGIAQPESLREACRTAALIVKNRAKRGS